MTAWETTTARVWVAIVWGAAVGALVVAAVFGASLASSITTIEVLLSLGLIAYCVAFPVFLAGLALLARPVWRIMDRAGLRSWPWGIALGVALGFVTPVMLDQMFVCWAHESSSDSGGPTVVAGVLTSHGWENLSLSSAIFAALCGVLGLLIWRIAYRRSTVASGSGGDRRGPQAAS